MAVDKVKKYLAKYGLDDHVLEFSTSTATVKEAAKALGCSEAEIAKSLSFIVNNEPILIVMAGDSKIDNSKYRHTFGIKSKMIPADLVEEIIGHPVGGVCPFALNENVKVYLDESLKRFKYVYPACGSSKSAIKLTIKELEEYSNCSNWIDVGAIYE